jgi:ADP-heptose:LPS heptosyltransferase
MKKILIIRFSSIGDIVLTSPVARCLKNQFPDAELHYLTKKEYVPLLAANPHISKILTIKDKVSEITSLLKAENYDYIVDLHHNLRSFQVKLALRKPSSTFNKLNWERWLMVNFKINVLPKVHIVDRYFQAVKPLSVINDEKGLECFIPAADEVNLNSFPSSFRDGYIAFAIGAKHNTKQLPVHKIISICKGLSLPVILLGGENDVSKGAQIANAPESQDGDLGGNRIYNACGKFNINQTASIVRQAKKLITHDTGLMHIAAAFQKPIISVWGNTIPEFGMYPYKPGPGSQIIEVKGLSCRPCSKLGYNKCPKKHFKCMEEIDELKVTESIN